MPIFCFPGPQRAAVDIWSAHDEASIFRTHRPARTSPSVLVIAMLG
jgi:hypothetical protein